MSLTYKQTVDNYQDKTQKQDTREQMVAELVLLAQQLADKAQEEYKQALDEYQKMEQTQGSDPQDCLQMPRSWEVSNLKSRLDGVQKRYLEAQNSVTSCQRLHLQTFQGIPGGILSLISTIEQCGKSSWSLWIKACRIAVALDDLNHVRC